MAIIEVCYDLQFKLLPVPQLILLLLICVTKILELFPENHPLVNLLSKNTRRQLEMPFTRVQGCNTYFYYQGVPCLHWIFLTIVSNDGHSWFLKCRLGHPQCHPVGSVASVEVTVGTRHDSPMKQCSISECFSGMENFLHGSSEIHNNQIIAKYCLGKEEVKQRIRLRDTCKKNWQDLCWGLYCSCCYCSNSHLNVCRFWRW